MRQAIANTPTGPAHTIHLAVARFQWRWVTNPSQVTIPNRCLVLGADKTTPLGTSRESKFINDTLRFHRLWTGPAIPYLGYQLYPHSYPAGKYLGGM